MSAPTPPTQHDWNQRIAVAEKLIPLIGLLHRERNVVVSVYGRLLTNLSDIEILKAHRFARRITDKELDPEKTLTILQELTKLDLGTASIDLGQLANGFDAADAPLREYLEGELAAVIGTANDTPQTDIVLYGFGWASARPDSHQPPVGGHRLPSARHCGPQE